MLRKCQPKAVGIVAVAAALAALVVCAVGAASASAAPEILICMLVTAGTGSYESEAKCEKGDTTGTNSLDWERQPPLVGQKAELDFNGTSGHLNTPNHEIECTANSGSALVEGANTYGKITIKFTGCKDTFFGSSCNSTEPVGASGEILTKELDSEVVYLKSGAKTPIGLLLLPTGSTTFTKISCVGGLLKESVTGEVLGELESAGLNKMVESLSVSFEENAGSQLWTKIEETATKHELTAFGEKAYEVATNTIECLVEEDVSPFAMKKKSCEIMV